MSLVAMSATSEVAVSSYLEQARDWLAKAVDETGPEQIAAAKAEIATAAEATKQLGLSKDIQLDAQEMVRRAEYALGKAIRKGQAEGEIATHGQTSSDLKSALDFGSRGEMYGASGADGVLGLADETPDPEAFDAALGAAREEGNLSRANVTRKAREICDRPAPEPKAAPRKPLPDQFRDRLYDLGLKVESLHRLVADDRWTQNAEKLAAAKNRNELLRLNDLIEQVINSLPTASLPTQEPTNV